MPLRGMMIINAKVLFLDCNSGLSGDMFLGAMLDLGLDETVFLKELEKLPLTDYEVEIRKSSNGGITGTKVDIKTHEHHPHRGLSTIHKIIDDSTLSEGVKARSKEAFRKLAQAEGKIHGKSPEEIHFHEVGAVDSIVDIVGAFILMEMMAPVKVIASPVNIGHGTVKCAHGVLPVPAPATTELLKGIPVYSQGEPGELTTPTGALLLASFADGFGSIPAGTIVKMGYGLGTAVRTSPNVFRVVLMEDTLSQETAGFDHDTVVVIEANIDDMNPQFYDTVMENLFAAGALDVFLTPIIMKKSRPGIKLTCLCSKDKRSLLAEKILMETTTIGVREYEVHRTKFFRSIDTITTPLGDLRIKQLKRGDETLRITPEYDDLKAMAKEQDLSLVEITDTLRPLLTLPGK